MMKRTGIAILLGLGGFALGSVIARLTEREDARPADAADARPAMRHISQYASPPAPEKPARDPARSGR